MNCVSYTSQPGGRTESFHLHQRSVSQLCVSFGKTIRLVALLFFASGLIAHSQVQSTDNQPNMKFNRLQRLEYFHQRRAYPFKHVPKGAYLKAMQQLNQMLAAEGGVSPYIVGATGWKQIGSQPISSPWWGINSGRVSALAVDPSNSQTAYLGAADGGVWKTADGGAHWTPTTDKQVSMSSGAIVVAPSNPSIVYVGTGEQDFSADSYSGAGILKSTNGGSTWTNLPGPFLGMSIGSLAVHPTNSSIVLAAASWYGGIYRSTDGGNTWTKVLSGTAGTKVMFDSTGNTAYAALGNIFGDTTNGVYKSIDGGVTWAADNGVTGSALPLSTAGRITLGMAPSQPSIVYAALQDTSNFGASLGMYKTTDGGAHWSALSGAPSSLCDSQCWYDLVVSVDPSNTNIVYAGGAFTGTLFQTLNGGTTWTNVTDGANGIVLHPDLHAVVFDNTGATLYVGDDGGVWRSTNPTSSSINWTSLNATLATTQFYPGHSIDPTNVKRGFGGTQDNSTENYVGSLTWNSVTCGDGGFTAIDYTSPSTVYATCQQGNIQKSTSGGGLGTWITMQTGVNTGDRVLWIPPLILDSTNHLQLYFGTYRVYQTINGAGSWQAISGDLTGGGEVSAIAVAPSNGNTVYVGSSDGHVNVTTNAGSGTGAIWTDRTTGVPSRYVSAIAVNPSSSTTVYITLAGTGSGHVYKSTNGGATWTNINGNLPDIAANAIVVDPVLPNTLYVGTDIGTFATTNGGTTWSTLVNGLPRTQVLSLKLDPGTRTLRAATHGRSAWDTHLALADLAVTMTEAPNPVPHGTNLTYTIKVTNNGPDAALTVKLTDAVPSGTTFVSIAPTGATCSMPAVGGTGTVTCTTASLANAASFSVVLTVHDTAASGSTITNTAKAASATPDPKTTNNAVTVKTSVD